ncbi:MAG: ParB/RepB/Spo0J family partition protein [Oscillospiraceae bacterium]|nr:ParB/RepB/Spo0J family partition protein [Oscillospiraceae bacterium]
MAKKFELGNGFESLFDDNSVDLSVVQSMNPSLIEPNKKQPRREFESSAIDELADSIKIHGIISPIVVRPVGEGFYQIVAGERRWRAAKRLGLSEVPVIVKEYDDKEAMQIALIENLQRENLNPIEEALGYKQLADEFEMKQEDIAKTVGKSRSAVANSLRLLNLPDEIRDMLSKGMLSTGHAKVLAGMDDEEAMIELALRACDGKMTVRDVERACSAAQNKSEKAEIPTYYKETEIAMRERLGRKVSISYGKNKGSLKIEFYDENDLASIAEVLCDKF